LATLGASQADVLDKRNTACQVQAETGIGLRGPKRHGKNGVVSQVHFRRRAGSKSRAERQLASSFSIGTAMLSMETRRTLFFASLRT